MPIKDKRRYPPDWKDIAHSIKNKANWQCQECGNPCKHSNESWIHFENRLLRNRPDLPQPIIRGRYILTVAHLDHTPENCAIENLKALCAVCHLRYDTQHHVQSRKVNKLKKQEKGAK